MNETIYSSNNKKGLLQSLGPFKIATSGKSLAGSTFPKVIKIPAIKLNTTLILDTTIELGQVGPEIDSSSAAEELSEEE